MGVNLRIVAHTGSTQPERFHRPGQIGIPVAPFQRQAFAESGFVDLDDTDAGSLQIGHFIADRQGNLPAGLRA